MMYASCRSCLVDSRLVSSKCLKKSWEYTGGISPSLLSPQGGITYIRERGIPERINRTALGAMVAPGPLGDAIVSLCCVVLLFPRRGPPPSSGGIGSAGPGEKNAGG